MKSKSKTILLVEDEAIIAMIEKKILEKYNYEVVVCHSGEKAIEAVNSGPSPDMILMDIDLGQGIDGTETASIILQKFDIPLVFLSAHTEPEVVEKTEGITSYGYIVKNSGETVLIASIKMAFRLFEEKQRVKIHENELKASTEALTRSELSVRKKLKAITDPDGDIEELSLSDIIDIKQLQLMMEDFYSISGILSAVLDSSGNILLAVGWQDICTKFHRCNSETLKNCIESDTALSKGVKPGSFKIYKCKNNMWDVVTPITLYGKHIGNVFFGQFFFEDEVPDRSLFIEQARRYGFNEKDYLEALDRVPKLSREAVEKGMSFISRLTDLVSTLSYRTIQLARIVTELKQNEEIINSNSFYLKSIFKVAPVGIGVVVDRTIIQTNKKISEITGYSREELLGKTARILYATDEDYEYVGKEKYRQITEKGTGTVQTFWKRKDGETIQILLSSTPLEPDDLQRGVTFTALDITEQKKNEELIRLQNEELEAANQELTAAMEELEAANEELINTNDALIESEELFRSLFFNHSAVKIIIDPDTRYIIDANNAAVDFYGWSRDELKKMTIEQINTLSLEEIKKEMERAKNLKRVQFEFRHRLADGSIKDVEVYSSGIDIKGKTLIHSIIHDITGRKKVEKQNEQLFTEKELLLRESHHRVKNNMNTIHGLLFIQSELEQDSRCREVISDAASRVQSMMALYDRLYRNSSTNEADINEFLIPLMEEIIRIYGRGIPVELDCNIENHQLSLRTLSTMAIIINELITNSIKHAFKNMDKGIITVIAKKNGTALTIFFKDNGRNASGAETLSDTTGFGMHLVEMLVSQLDGSMEINNEAGLSYRFTFPYQ